MMSFGETVTSLQNFQFTANLEQSGSWISGAQSVKRIFLLTVTFYLTKNKKGTKKPFTQLSHYCLEEKYYLGQKH